MDDTVDGVWKTPIGRIGHVITCRTKVPAQSASSRRMCLFHALSPHASAGSGVGGYEKSTSSYYICILKEKVNFVANNSQSLTDKKRKNLLMSR